MDAPTVVCVLRTQPGRSSGVYRPEHVVHLLAQVEHWWPSTVPLRCVVLCDTTTGLGVEERRLMHDWPGWWSKLELFRPDLQDLGAILYFDLDTEIVGALDDVVLVSRLTMLRDFYTASALGSGLMLLPAAARPAVWAAWMRSPSVFQRKYRGDQNFLAAQWATEAVHRWQDTLPGNGVISFKVHVKPRRRIPEGAKVICFHGRPRPWETPEWFRQAVAACR